MQKYLNKPFVLGETDCLSLIIDFYKDKYDIDLPNYARPEGFWNADYDWYMERFEEEGFYLLGENPKHWQEGDIFLMAIGSKFATHAAIFIGNNKILHLFNDRVSTIDTYKGVWRNNTVARVRHISQKDRKVKHETFNILKHPNFARLRERAIREGVVDSEGELIGSSECSEEPKE